MGFGVWKIHFFGVLMHFSQGLMAPAPQMPFRLDRMKFMATRKPVSPVMTPPSRQSEGGDSLVLDRITDKIKPPQMYQVLMLNDDFTPMEFVVLVIQEFFSKDRESATQIMLKIHLDGKAVCGVYSKDVAATKVDQVSDAARQAGHPLQCVCEPVE
jgi:ATP-dependent Clp protease adaptor protein ClpS